MDYDTKKSPYEGMTVSELRELIPFDGPEDDELSAALHKAVIKESKEKPK